MDAQTEVTRLASENQTLRGVQDQLTVAEERSAKLQEELQVSRADVEKLSKGRDGVVAVNDNLSREMGDFKRVEFDVGEDTKGFGS